MNSETQESDIKDYLKNLRPRQAPGVETFEEGGEALLYSPEASHAVALNPTALVVFELCDGQRTTFEIARLLSEETGEDQKEITSAVINTLLSLRENHIIDIDGLARRQEPEVDEKKAQNFQNDRLDFRLPEFTRLSWVSDTARSVWEKRFQQIHDTWQEIEWRSVREGLRKCALTNTSPDTLVKLAARLLKEGLTVLPVAVHDASHSYSSQATPPKEGQPISIRVAIGQPDDVLELKNALDTSNNTRIGELLGYPECCRGFFEEIWVRKGMVDTTWPMALNSVDLDPRNPEPHTLEIPMRSPHQANILWRWMGVRAVPHLPCSFNCTDTVAFADDLLAIGKKAGFTEEIGWIEEILSWPVEWTALHGIAEIKTPILKVSTRTDATAHKFAVQKRGNAYPEEGATGVDFPYKNEGKPKLTGSKAYQQGLEHTISLDSASNLSWYASDNGFSSLEEMEKAHAPILGLAVDALPAEGASVLDLGCGNGALLKALCEQRPETIPFGLEADGSRVDHAKLLLPQHEGNFFVGDIFENLDLVLDDDTRFSLVMLMPGRLIETSRAKAEMLKAQLSRHTDQVLLYAYVDWLTRYGGFHELLEKAGISAPRTSADSGVAIVESKALLAK